jgi:glycosyltransferase involved in cell wall biosynthesis
MISLAITTFNRSGFVIESFINVLDNPFISEIVIVDDCSEMVVFNNLKLILDYINNPKIKLFRNEANLGVFANKALILEKCTNDWIILWDSDNVIDNDYIDIIRSLEWEKDTVYCPEVLYNVTKTEVSWSYSEFKDIVVDRSNAKQYIEDVNFETHLNTGNNFFNREFRLEALKLVDEPISDICSGDGTYNSYLWLLNGGKIKVVDGLSYYHRQHSGSWYLNHIEQGVAFNFKTYEKIRNLSDDNK